MTPRPFSGPSKPARRTQLFASTPRTTRSTPRSLSSIFVSYFPHIKSARLDDRICALDNVTVLLDGNLLLPNNITAVQLAINATRNPASVSLPFPNLLAFCAVRLTQHTLFHRPTRHLGFTSKEPTSPLRARKTLLLAGFTALANNGGIKETGCVSPPSDDSPAPL